MAGGVRRSRHHTLTWRVSRAIEHAGSSRLALRRTGPAWVFALLGLGTELVLAPVVLAITLVVGLVSYLILDAPWTKVRSQQRPRFVSTRLLYLNTLIVAGFWLAVMFTFSAADPAMSTGVEQKLPALIATATASDLRTLITLKNQAMIEAVKEPVGVGSTWFGVFLHGLISAVALNFLLFALVVAHRRLRAHRFTRGSSGRAIRYDSLLGLFVDDRTGTSG